MRRYIILRESVFIHDYFWSVSFQHGEGNGNPLQYSCLENPMDRGAWWAAVHGVTKRLSYFTFTFHSHALEKEMATHSSVLAWRIPGMGEPDGLPSVVSHRVANDWSDLAAAAAEKARASLPSPLWCLSIPKSWAFKLTMSFCKIILTHCIIYI